ncbi:MAG: hypothetical protein HY815_29245 [Candidatus Riflebacteria bacterium]|nr:hypothetical protein [Candidatus Riflebacteria bacterium]
MDSSIARRQQMVAGVVRALCVCCAVRQTLVTHQDLGDARRACPTTGRTYLDRGDGLFEPDGEQLATTEIVVASTPRAEDQPGLLSDRPKRTGPKTRIELEKATFASSSDPREVWPWNRS